MQINYFGQSFILSPEKVLFWVEQKILVISDAHFSKEMHFRKNGIAIPTGILNDDLIKVEALINHFKPRTTLFLGDMFHSEENEGLHEFMAWRKKNNYHLQLVIGNHDVLQQEWYTFANVELIVDALTIENIVFSHDKLNEIPEGKINFYGHLHPAVRLQGLARQVLRLPCFYIGNNFIIFPAFGKFTGAKAVKSKKGDAIYAIADAEIIRVQ